jgi:5,10-methylene-tetrahydrofolate dehydrogenase/methenyl tetrahydrofolate cyclohydrolase
MSLSLGIHPADLQEQVKRADILIVAIGKPEFVKASAIGCQY